MDERAEFALQRAELAYQGGLISRLSASRDAAEEALVLSEACRKSLQEHSEGQYATLKEQDAELNKLWTENAQLRLQIESNGKLAVRAREIVAASHKAAQAAKDAKQRVREARASLAQASEDVDEAMKISAQIADLDHRVFGDDDAALDAADKEDAALDAADVNNVAISRYVATRCTHCREDCGTERRPTVEEVRHNSAVCPPLQKAVPSQRTQGASET
jgi:hypothetical protein